MYDWPEFRSGLTAFWRLLERELDVPLPDLVHDVPLPPVWRDPDLSIGWCCGWNVAVEEIGAAAPFARPLWDMPGHGPGTYHSLIVCRDEDAVRPLEEFLSAPVINGPDSWSGCHVFNRWLAGRGLALHNPKVSGGHRASLAALRGGAARVAAIDAVCWRLADRLGETAGLTVIGETDDYASTPFLLGPALQDRAEEAFAAFSRALKQPEAQEWVEAIGITGILPAAPKDYAPMLPR
ncbi:MAG: PhnD/SsuA/transferrin family substrate-binding protein [Pseudomonadota bacterium]